ncbi:MAG: chemotaxis protein CheW [Limnospira sp. PMC 1291.21]|uniref:Chemotaxis protein CheW Chemotaxis signal transduction protein n=3 Tax=Limnospira TaxID=2596745 RepID=A0A9P1NXT6_9CYAN|nr:MULTISPECIES: chemotaxis protein CheW [Limnospira]MDC0840065.1 chemotaxis protein CheW [Limnoraphis robusta]MDY7053528.1 chemotaxis protein CheW [Limnospira fusiformis LS22]QJB27316.1 chemotaxis protein CheW [Limnospira fusiformis SAG 85.79]RAQ44161.1 chemotaxis protein CheW [Arthrospira sp. O9.13F]EDZ93984.1 CheW protein [Limnospira maxima CS-328]
METKPYLMFKLGGLNYGVDGFLVQEIFSLPELTPIVEAAPELVGILNLRSELLSIIDLNIHFGLAYSQNPYAIDDIIIVLQLGDEKLGILVNEVCEVQMISSEDITSKIPYSMMVEIPSYHSSGSHHHAIAGYAEIEDQIIMIINPESLRDHIISDSPEIISDRSNSHRDSLGSETHRDDHDYPVPKNRKIPAFCPDATPEERQIFRERAENLRRKTEKDELSGLMSLAVIGLNGEYFGVNLSIIREFTDIHNVTPIPCTPPHIVGNMNLRGEIVTLVDIRGILGLPMDINGNSQKAAIVQVGEVVAGIIVNDIFDVTYLNPSAIKLVPAAVHSTQDEYLRGTAIYRDRQNPQAQNRMMSLLDLEKILVQETLVVNEEI